MSRGPDKDEETALMIYDGECGFCTYWARRWRQKIGPMLEITPLQDEATRPDGLSKQTLEEAVHVVDTDGEIYRGAEAVFLALAMGRRRGLGLWLYRHLPGFRPLAELGYRWVADHRMFVSRWTRWMRRDDIMSPEHSDDEAR